MIYENPLFLALSSSMLLAPILTHAEGEKPQQLPNSLTFRRRCYYSVPGSGMQAKGQLLSSKLHVPAWLTGGTASPEGSAIGLAVLAISFPILAKLFTASDRHNTTNSECAPTLSMTP